MKPSPLKALTPFITSGLKSPTLKKICHFTNVVYCTTSCLLIIAFSLWNPLGFGWIISGGLAFVVCWIVGCILHLFQVASTNDDIKSFNQYVNTVFAKINDDIVQENSEIGHKQESLQMFYNKPEDIDKINSPFSSKEGEEAIGQILSKSKDHSIKADSAKAIAEVLTELNKQATANYKFLDSKSDKQKYVLLWLCKKYFKKLTTDEFNSLYTAKKADKYIEEWEKEFKPLFGPNRIEKVNENSAIPE